MRLHLAPVMSILSFIRYLPAPSAVPVAIGQPSPCGGVVQVFLLVVQVAGALVSALALSAGVAVGGGAAADPAATSADLLAGSCGAGRRPIPRRRARPCRRPTRPLSSIFGDVDEIDHDRDRDAPLFRLGGDGLDLRVVPVDEHGQFPLVSGVTPLGLAECPAVDGRDVVGDRRGQPLPRACGPRGFALFFPAAARRSSAFFSSASARACGSPLPAGGDGDGVVDAAASAIRLRPCFSPGESLVTSLFSAACAAFAVTGRGASGRVTMPLPSNVRTSGKSSSGGSPSSRQA